MAEALSSRILVAGMGPAGIAAATRAAECGADVLAVDESPRAGGQIWKSRGGALPPRARRWIARLARSGARVLPGVEIVAAPSTGRLAARRTDGSERAVELSFEKLVLATGARELFLPFPGWTLTNVVGAGAAQSLVKSGAVVRGRRAVVAGSGPLLLAAAAGLASAGARVEVVAEQASAAALARFAFALLRSPRKLADAAAYRARFPRSRYRTGVWVERAEGDGRVRAAILTDGARSWSVPCDLLCCGYGLVPNLELPLLLGCATTAGSVSVDDALETSRPGVFCAGELTGIGGVDRALVEGEIAGLAAAGRADSARALLPRRRRLLAFARALETAFALRPELRALPRPDTLVCRCEDVAYGRLDRSWRFRQAKLYTRVGMGACQAKVCGPALEFLFGWERDSIRPPLRAVSISTLASVCDADESLRDDEAGR